MTKMTRRQLVEFDTRELAAYKELWQIEATLPSVNSLVHRHAGDQQVSNGYGRPKSWKMSDAEARGHLEHLASSYNYPQDPSSSLTPADVLARIEQVELDIAERRQVIAGMERLYAQDPWTRYFPCLNRDGHIHSSLRGCPTVRWDTDMGWAVEMSGLSADQAIHGVEGQFEGLGETLCSVCFPDAPAEWCRTRSEVTRAEREAAKAACQEAKYAKQLRPEGEMFREEGGHGPLVTTVARCLALLREEVELRDYYGRGEHPSHFRSVTDAERARQVLLAREERQPGTGATQAAIDKVIASAVKKNIKEGARLDPKTGRAL